jgi:uncharacterized protein YabN with tetrapyrrole methylase and pyrophosphatase domain
VDGAESCPALLRAYRIQQKAPPSDSIGKTQPGLGKGARKSRIDEVIESERSRIQEEFGDLLFALVNLPVHQGPSETL